MADGRKERKITQVSTFPIKNESPSIAGIVALADDGTAWIAYATGEGEYSDWEFLPPLPDKP